MEACVEMGVVWKHVWRWGLYGSMCGDGGPNCQVPFDSSQCAPGDDGGVHGGVQGASAEAGGSGGKGYQ